MRETWAPGCDGFLAFSTHADPRIPAVKIEPLEGEEAYGNMWQKVRAIWKYAMRYISQFDFFYICGHDTLMMPQHLRDYLQTTKKDPNQLHLLGRHFVAPPDTAFYSGGAGYVLSRAMLVLLKEHFNKTYCAPHTRSAQEDVRIAVCLKRAAAEAGQSGAVMVGSADDQDRERFHPFEPGRHFTMRYENPDDWYYKYSQTKTVGKDYCSPKSISFHYIKTPYHMRHLWALLNRMPKADTQK